MIYNVDMIVWKDIISWEKQPLDENKFIFPRMLSIGIVFKEDDKKVVLVYVFDLDPSIKTSQNDFIVIPKEVILERNTVATYDSDTGKVVTKD